MLNLLALLLWAGRRVGVFTPPQTASYRGTVLTRPALEGDVATGPRYAGTHTTGPRYTGTVHTYPA